MTTAFLTHADCLQHVTPPGHPERVDRLMVIYRAIDAIDDTSLIMQKLPMGADEHILRVHPLSHIERVRDAAPNDGFRSLDADTHMSPGSLTAAYRAVGGIVSAVDQVIAGDVSNAFVAARPPGHHSETETPMGFCLFGTIAIGAKHTLEHHGLSRVAVVDFDVHHGNGTQDLLWNEASCLFISSHQMPLYPGSGAPHERGAHENILNIPLQPNSGGREMRQAYEREVFPALERFEPELILVSAGFDAHRNDPLANLNWDEEDFAWITEKLCDVADQFCHGKIVSTLEGGYDLDGLSNSVRSHVEVLLKRGKND